MLSNSVCSQTHDKQIGLLLHSRPIISLVWLQTGLDSYQPHYHYWHFNLIYNTLKQTQTWQLNFFFIGMCYAWQHWSLIKEWSSRPLLKMLSVSQIDVSLLCVCPLIDDQLHHKIVKVAVEPQAAGEWFHSKLWQCYDKIYLQ